MRLWNPKADSVATRRQFVVIGAVVTALLFSTAGYSQSNTSVSLPPGTVITLPANAPMTNAASIMPPDISPERIHAMALELRASRFMAERVQSPYAQRFEVTQVEEVASMDADRDDKGLLTGTFSPLTNYVATLHPAGTNAPNIRGATKDGALSLILSFRVTAGDRLFIYRGRNGEN